MFEKMKSASAVMVVVASSLCLSACTDSGGVSTLSESTGNSGGGNDVDFDYPAMFANLVDNIIIPNYSSFSANIQSFHGPDGALTAYCASIGDTNESASRAAAQTQWLSLMAKWQQIELHQVGPVVTDASQRARIHSYGATSGVDTCLVDRNVVRAGDEDFSISQWLYPARGLESIEYLLFEDGLRFTCPSQEEQTSVWQTMSELERKAARCHYMQLAAEDISDAAQGIADAWNAEGGSRGTFVDGEDVGQTLQSLSDALFYLEKYTKDIKLGISTGIKRPGSGTDYCESSACPERVESPFSESSLQNVRNNLQGFWQLFTGGTGPGFDDLIQARGLASVNAAFETEVQSAIDFVDAMLVRELTLYSQAELILQNDHRSECTASQGSDSLDTLYPACALHTKLKNITDLLRIDFVTAVNVSLPQSAQSDGD